MPWKDLDNWIAAKFFVMGFPFMTTEGDQHVNPTRVIESLIISLGTAAIIGLIGWLLLIPKMESDISILRYEIQKVAEQNKMMHTQSKANTAVMINAIRDDISDIKDDIRIIKRSK